MFAIGGGSHSYLTLFSPTSPANYGPFSNNASFILYLYIVAVCCWQCLVVEHSEFGGIVCRTKHESAYREAIAFSISMGDRPIGSPPPAHSIVDCLGFSLPRISETHNTNRCGVWLKVGCCVRCFLLYLEGSFLRSTQCTPGLR